MIIAVDIGTSRIKAILYDPDQNQVLQQSDQPTLNCQVANLPAGWSELDPLKILDTTRSVLEDIMTHLPPGLNLAGLTFTGAMHGVLLVDLEGNPLTNLIDWRDRRVLDYQPEFNGSTLDHLLSRYGTDWASLHTGCEPASGYGVSTLYWYAATQTLPTQTAYVCTIVDFVISRLIVKPPLTDYSLAASTGLFDILKQTWHQDFLSDLGLKNIKLPEVVATGTRIGSWRGIKVLAPSGDHTAAVYAVLQKDETHIHLNIGTGSQVAVCSTRPYFNRQIETRPGLGQTYLLVAAGSVGGRTLDDWLAMIKELFPGTSAKSLSFEELLLAAQAIKPGCEGLQMEPIFSGTRTEPARRGSIKGISSTNFTLGHLTRACFEGMAAEWLHGLSLIQAGPKQQYETLFLTGRLATAGNLLEQIVKDKFGLKVEVVTSSEVSGLGAARYAARYSGATHFS